MVSRLWDLLVVGAGPGGCRVAELFAQKGASVIMLDPRAPWEKPCGGGLTAAALANTPALHELDDHSQKISELQIVASNGTSVCVHLSKPYRALSRFNLSIWGLERAVNAGVRFRSQTVRDIERTGAYWLITDADGAKYYGRWLIGADGATSKLRRILAPGLRPELAPTRVAYAEVTSQPQRAVFWFLAGADGYLWDFARPEGHSVGVGVPPGSFARSDLDGAIRQYLLAQTGHAAPVSHKGAVIATSLWSTGHFSDIGDERYALVGDAAGLANPATGEGIDYALRSAALAVTSFTWEQGFRMYPRAVRLAFGAEFRRARLIRKYLYNSTINSILVGRAQHSIRARKTLTALADMINEHLPLRAVPMRLWSLDGMPVETGIHGTCLCDRDDPDPYGDRASAIPNAVANSAGRRSQ